SSLIGQPLAANANSGAREASIIVNPERSSLVVAEIELGEIALQMLLADVMVDPGDATLQNREVVLDCVCVPEAATDIFLDRVIDCTMPSEIPPDRSVGGRFVGHQIRPLVDVGAKNRAQRLGVNCRDVKRANCAVPL